MRGRWPWGYGSVLSIIISIPDINDICNSHFRKIIVENFPPLEKAGGFELLRCVPNTKQLELYSELAQSNPKVLQERSNKGKIYIRPVQRDMIVPSRKTMHVRSCVV